MNSYTSEKPSEAMTRLSNSSMRSFYRSGIGGGRECSPSPVSSFIRIVLSTADSNVFVATSFLTDTSDHLWRSAIASPPSARVPGDYRQIISRIPAKLDPALIKEPRVIQGVPRMRQTGARRKPIPSMLNPMFGKAAGGT